MYSGIGQGAGPMLGGYIMDHLGGSTTFLIFAGISFVVLLFSLMIQQILKFKTSKTEYNPIPTKEGSLLFQEP
jgi:MFS family permease